jgi:DNA replication protein DnaC
VLREQTFDKLRQLHLSGMAAALERQLAQPDIETLSFEERLALLVDNEWMTRQNRLVSRLLRQANLRLPACVEDIDYRHDRGIDKAQIVRLAAGGYIMRHQNLAITGPTGAGKTFLACALGQAACRLGHTVKYFRLPRLLGDLVIARGDGSWLRLLSTLRKTSLLILDDWGLQPFTATEGRDLLELIEDRYGAGATLIAGQLPVEHWHGLFPDPTLAEAVLDRLVHNAYRINLRGESMRKVQAQLQEQASSPGGV